MNNILNSLHELANSLGSGMSSGAEALRTYLNGSPSSTDSQMGTARPANNLSDTSSSNEGTTRNDPMGLSDDSRQTASDNSQAANDIQKVLSKPITTEKDLGAALWGLLRYVHNKNEQSQVIVKKIESLKAKQEIMSRIQDLLIETTKENGTLDITNHNELKQLLQNASRLGIDLDPKKCVYNKKELESFKRTLERMSRKLQDDIGLQMKEADKITAQWQETIKIAQKAINDYNDLIRKMIQNINSHR